jgi:ketosteroid isomerase-like protein
MLSKGKLMVAVLALLSVSVLCAGVAAAHADEKEARHDLEAVYAKVDQATKNKDIKALRAYMAEDFSAKTQDGKVLTRDEALSALEQSLGAMGEIHSSVTTIDSLKEEGDAVIVETTQTVKASATGPDNKSHEVVATAKSRDTWAHTKQGWMIKHSEDLGQSVTVDGHPMG